MEWNALVTFGFQPVTGDASEGGHQRDQHQPRLRRSYSASRLMHSEFIPPKANWGLLKDAKLDA